jgi:hypothetical protein
MPDVLVIPGVLLLVAWLSFDDSQPASRCDAVNLKLCVQMLYLKLFLKYCLITPVIVYSEEILAHVDLSSALDLKLSLYWDPPILFGERRFSKHIGIGIRVQD